MPLQLRSAIQQSYVKSTSLPCACRTANPMIVELLNREGLAPVSMRWTPSLAPAERAQLLAARLQSGSLG